MTDEKVSIRFVLLLFILSCSTTYAQHAVTRIGSFDRLDDIGSPAIAGSVTYSEPAQTYELMGSGSNIWFGRDSFSFLNIAIKGDFILQAQMKFVGQSYEPHRKAGLMIRSSNAPDSPVIACTVHGDGLTAFQYRTTTGGLMKEVKWKIVAPDIIQLEKKGNVYTMSVAHFGEVYQVERLDSISLGEDLVAGLFICSHNNAYVEGAVFSNVRIFNTAPDNLIQYKNYLESLLEVVDVTSGRRGVIASDKGSWQAPNWTTDGNALIYNASGKLYNFNLTTKLSTLINTDFATKNNNDHVLSFDGTKIGISHHSAEANGQSIVYVVPATGGVPERVTENGPSYFHGWSPDNQFLLFTGIRKGEADIYKISSAGGKEIRLTNAKGLDDGSEFSPDGKYIYFNSARTGTMQIWRMSPNGKNQTQLTTGELNNWFPHVSPDNKWLVFISFSAQVPADQHSFYERVYLRMMPIEGGEPKVIAYLYGGQGTINVPSWSPDGKKIAFVSNGTF